MAHRVSVWKSALNLCAGVSITCEVVHLLHPRRLDTDFPSVQTRDFLLNDSDFRSYQAVLDQELPARLVKLMFATGVNSRSMNSLPSPVSTLLILTGQAWYSVPGNARA
jgi:hypothetical protein